MAVKTPKEDGIVVAAVDGLAAKRRRKEPVVYDQTIYWAACRRDLDECERLLAAGVSADSVGGPLRENALTAAAQKGYTDVAQLFGQRRGHQ